MDAAGKSDAGAPARASKPWRQAPDASRAHVILVVSAAVAIVLSAAPCEAADPVEDLSHHRVATAPSRDSGDGARDIDWIDRLGRSLGPFSLRAERGRRDTGLDRTAVDFVDARAVAVSRRIANDLWLGLSVDFGNGSTWQDETRRTLVGFAFERRFR